MNKEFVRVRSTRDILISSVMTVLGIVLIAIPSSVSVNIFGTVLAVPGILMLLFLKTGYKDVGVSVQSYEDTFSFNEESMSFLAVAE